MGEHRPAPPTLQQRLYWPIAVACGAVMLAGTIGAAQAVAPQVAAAEHLAFTPERPAEPSAHGGPLAPLSIGVVAPERDVPVVPPIVRSSRPTQRPQEALGTVRGSTDTQTALTGAPSDKPAAATTAPEPAATPPTATAAATTRTCRWCHHTSPATTTETTTAATTTAATETTSETEPSDPLATLIDDVIGTEGP